MQDSQNSMGKPSATPFLSRTARALKLSPDISYVTQYAPDERYSLTAIIIWIAVAILFWLAAMLTSGVFSSILFAVAIISTLANILVVRNYRSAPSADLATTAYEKGLLIPAVIVKERPLTLMSLTDISRSAKSDTPKIALQKSVLKVSLPSQPSVVGTRVPCCAVFGITSSKGKNNGLLIYPVDYASPDKTMVEKAEVAIPEEEWQLLEANIDRKMAVNTLVLIE